MTGPQDEYEGSYNADGDYDEDDPFAAPPKAINFGDEWTAGETYELPVLERPRLIRGLDNNRKPASWPDGQPKMVAVTTVEFNGQKRSLWAPKPSALMAGIKDAVATAGVSVRPGGTLVIKYDGLGKKERGKNAPHVFGEIVYIPPAE